LALPNSAYAFKESVVVVVVVVVVVGYFVVFSKTAQLVGRRPICDPLLVLFYLFL